MAEVSTETGEILGVAVTLAICLVPVATATILSYRSFRRGLWLAAPGGLFVAVSALTLLLFNVFDALGPGDQSLFGLATAIVFGSWITLGLFLTALAIAGPKLPTLDVAEVF